MKNILQVFVSSLFILTSLFFANNVLADDSIIISSFKANPSTIWEGESTTISWDVTGASSCVLNNNDDHVLISSHSISDPTVVTYVSKTLSPLITTNYDIICTNTNPTRSTTTTTIKVTVNTKPSDLTIYTNGSSQYSNASYPAGNPVTFRPRVWNSIGSSTKTSFYNKYEIISKTAKLDNSGNVINSQTIPDTTWTENSLITGRYQMPVLSAGGNAASNFSPYTFPSENNGPNGTYTAYKVRFCTDSDNQVTESNENNNCTPYSCWVSSSVVKNYGIDWGCADSEDPSVPDTKPDLVASAPSPSTAVVDTAVKFTSTITNQNTKTTGDTFYNSFEIATGENGAGPITPLISSTPSPMPALVGKGTETATSVSYQFTTVGTYSVRACADNNISMVGSIDESSEDNNCSGWVNVVVTEDTSKPKGTITATNCEIPLGGKNCQTSINWEVSNANETASSAVTTPTNEIVGTGNEGKEGYTLNFSSIPGSRTFYLYHDSKELSQATATATCTVGTSWSGTTCIKTELLPLGTLTATDCTIPLNGNSCSSNLEWHTTQPLDAVVSAVTTDPNNTKVAEGNDGTKQYTLSAPLNISVVPGTKTFYLYHNGRELDKKTATASCVSGALWNGSTCVEEASAPSGTLSGENCKIKKNESTCTTSLTLNVSKPVPNAKTNVTKPTNVEVISNSVINSVFPFTKSGIIVGYPSTEFFLNHYGVTLSRKVINASCEEGNHWNSSAKKCVEGGGDGDGDLCPDYPGNQKTLPCPVDGQWKENCGACNQNTCEQQCTRICVPPKDGGEDCPGNGKLEKNFTQKCYIGSACSKKGELEITFTANPAKIFKGRLSTLTWTSKADSCVAVSEEGFGLWNSGASLGYGNSSVAPIVTTTYKISCTKGNIIEYSTAKVTVNGISIKED